MYLCYDKAVKIGIEAYRSLGYAHSCVSAFRVTTSEFRKYMEKVNLPYSHELFHQWLNDNKKYWKAHKRKSARKALNILLDIMAHGCITTGLQTKINRTPSYIQLPNWSRTILDNYIESLKGTFRISYLTQIKNACSNFFLFLKNIGISKHSEITHEIVKNFFTRNKHISKKNKDRYDNIVSHCIIYLAEQGLIKKTVGLMLNKFVISDLLIVKDLPESERCKFTRFLNSCGKKISISKTKYTEATEQFNDIHKNMKYSSSICKTDSQVIRDFEIFMDANLFAYSHELALAWLDYQKKNGHEENTLYSEEFF